MSVTLSLPSIASDLCESGGERERQGPLFTTRNGLFIFRLERFELGDESELALAAAITHEILLGSKSRWCTYLESLPVYVVRFRGSVPVATADSELFLAAAAHVMMIFFGFNGAPTSSLGSALISEFLTLSLA